MNVNHNLLNTLHKLGSRSEPVERLYTRVTDEQLFLAAYAKLYSNKGAMTPGVNPEDQIDGMSLKRIRKIIAQLKSNEWQWQPVRRTYVPKANGKWRPLGIPGWSDKLVQEVIRMALEAYYEPIFHTESHGFRPNRSCHTALTEIKNTWTGVTWFIEGDIKSCFDEIDHETLLHVVGKRIRDFRFLKLLRTMLEAGYWENETHHKTIAGTPQGGIVSPLLANIFLHELDEFVLQTLKPAFDKGERKRINEQYQKFNNAYHRAKRKGNKEEALAFKKQRNEIPRSDPTDPNFRRLLYIRYADDFLIGVIGTKTEARDIKAKIRAKLAEMKLQLSEEKTVITNAAHGQARFLGYDIYKAHRTTNHQINGKIQLSVPQDRIREIASRYRKNGKPAHRNALIWADVAEIMLIFDMELRGYYNYYKLAYNVSNRLDWLKYTMWFSLMRTIAAKKKSSVAKMAKQYRTIGPKTGKKCIGVRLETERGERWITFGDFHIKVDEKPMYSHPDPYTPGLPSRELITRLKHNRCELCDKETEDLEVHHERRLNDIRKKVRQGKAPYWQQVMAFRNRKSLVVCKKCHHHIHATS
jgi:group II intron reverse transcriptase/maturase